MCNNLLVVKETGIGCCHALCQYQNQFDNCVRGGDYRMKKDGDDDPKGIFTWT